MDVVINGAPSTIEAGQTIAALLEALALPVDGVAVAVNLQVVPRSRHHETPLRDGDRVEIIRAVGGG